MTFPLTGASATSVPGVTGTNSADGNGVLGTSAQAEGVLGQTMSATSAAVAGENVGPGTGAGVFGSGTVATGVTGISAQGAGVYGSSTSGPGVTGISASGNGVLGTSSTAEGVLGQT